MSFFPYDINPGGAVRDVVAIMLHVKDTIPFRQAPNCFIGVFRGSKTKNFSWGPGRQFFSHMCVPPQISWSCFGLATY